MPDAFAILFDSNNGNVYNPGSWISGRVVLSLSKPQKTRGLRLKFQGYEHTLWTTTSHTGSGQNRRTHRKTHTETITIFDHIVVLFGYPPGQSISDNSLPELPPGNSVFPFRIQIPTSFLPPSVELPHGHVRYEISAYIDIVRWFDTCSPKYPIRIIPSLIVNTPNLLPPLSFNQDKVMGCFSNQGIINCFSSIHKQGYLPGETIFISSQVTNNSKKTISAINASLRSTIIYRAHHSTKDSSNTILFTVIEELILPQSPLKELQHQIIIPNNVLLSNNGRLISVSYVVNIMFRTKDCCGGNIEINLPIVIGNTVLSNQQPQPIVSTQNPPFQYNLEQPEHPGQLDVDLPPYTEIRGTESY